MCWGGGESYACVSYGVAMKSAPSQRTAAFTEDQIIAGFWFVAAKVHERLLDINPSATDPALEETLEPLVGSHGLKREHVKEAIPYIIAARNLAADKKLPSISSVKCDEARKNIINDRDCCASTKGALIWPTGARTVAVRLGEGNWNNALETLGMPTTTRGRAQGSGRFTQEAMAEAFIEFFAFCADLEIEPRIGTYATWSQTLRSQGRMDIPSVATIRQKFGTWTAVMDTMSTWEKNASPITTQCA